VLFYLIVLYGCVCQPLINGYDDDDDDTELRCMSEKTLKM